MATDGASRTQNITKEFENSGKRTLVAAELIQRADKLMYEAKGERASHIYLLQAQIKNGVLVEMTDSDPPAVEDSEV